MNFLSVLWWSQQIDLLPIKPTGERADSRLEQLKLFKRMRWNKLFILLHPAQIVFCMETTWLIGATFGCLTSHTSATTNTVIHTNRRFFFNNNNKSQFKTNNPEMKFRRSKKRKLLLLRGKSMISRDWTQVDVVVGIFSSAPPACLDYDHLYLHMASMM